MESTWKRENGSLWVFFVEHDNKKICLIFKESMTVKNNNNIRNKYNIILIRAANEGLLIYAYRWEDL